jgi:regulator of protease activity HflC (stomatin/prohibitin superfamily)
MKIRNIALIALLAGSVMACSKVPAGNVGVKVYLLGGSKGVDSEELGVGRYWIGINEELYLFPTFMQNYEWTADSRNGSETDESISFQTVEGLTVNADVGISYSIDPTKVTTIYQTYRRGVDEITDTFLRNMVRDALVKVSSDKPVDYVYGAGKASLIEQTLKIVQDQVAEQGIMVSKIYWIGEIRLPSNVIESINVKIEATQRAQQRRNEVEQAKAEADKKIEEARGQAESILRVAEAQAKANKLLADSLTSEFVQYQAITKWDGILPKMTGSSAIPFVDVTKDSGIQ